MNDTDRLSGIRTRAENATAGPWAYEPGEQLHGPDAAEIHYVSTVADIDADDPPMTSLYSEADARFVAAAREDVPWLLAEIEQARSENAVLTVQLRNSEKCALRELQAQEAAEDREAERDRARATAVTLEQENAATEEARQAWATTAQQQLAEMTADRDEWKRLACHHAGESSVQRSDTESVRRELEHERSLSRRLASEGTAIATAIQRVRDEHEESDGTCSSCIGWDEKPQAWPCATITALDGEVPDAD